MVRYGYVSQRQINSEMALFEHRNNWNKSDARSFLSGHKKIIKHKSVWVSSA